jgi:hypothetical protein
MMSRLQTAYQYPVDIEYTANFDGAGRLSVNLLQCRPLQTKGLGKGVEFPEITPDEKLIFSISGNFMGGNIRQPIQCIIYIKPEEYSVLADNDKYTVARMIGKLNSILSYEHIDTMLLGPGRWGTSTPSLGVPVHFSEINGVAVLCEIEFETAGLMPEISYGSHFFQDLVETGIFYTAIFPQNKEVRFNKGLLDGYRNAVKDLIDTHNLDHVIHVIFPPEAEFEVYSDIVTQRCICRLVKES